jgi:hypothetical protein
MRAMNPDVPLQPLDVPVLAAATVTEQHIHHVVDSFEMSGARLYGITIDDINTLQEEQVESVRVSFLAQHPDVYELLQAPTSSLGRMFHAAAIVTTGWAAPLGPDGSVEGAPSEHALRRRVRLVVVVCDAGVASVIRFEDAPDDVVVDDGSATGSLAEAIHSYWYDPPVAQQAQ